MLLKNKNILVAVTGSIAIYKTLELIRLYIKAGASVKVIMTNEAKKFINPITFEAISQNKVLEENSESWDKNELYNHIDIGKWADIFVIAPASANTINKLSHGLADNLLTQTALAYPRVKLLCPAANTNMIKNPITQASLKMLALCNYEILQTQTKELVCKDVGDGAMAEPQEIFYATARELLKEEYWNNRKVVLSGGGTIEKIDDVRYISNFSSGKMASSLALALYFKGADVCLVSTRGHETLPNAIHTIEVQSSNEMYEYLVDSIRVAKKGKLSKTTLMDSSTPTQILKRPFLFMVAAVSDYLPTFPQEGKLKKELLGTSWELKLKQNMDILNALDKSDIVSIGFKAEMDETVAYENALKMLEKKSLDAVCLNIIKDENAFGSNSNSIELLLKNKIHSFKASKLELSLELLTCLEKEFDEYK
ncbi:bifunctional phosphopantothenoylcysteine decarboxylase/phosphopantothenate--cysteine ligase CoaBC [Malaciobacter mytili]|uniref:Coenzyme A biosynthesis bifunctional protein CoaBC n=1 Tax=Malaciobacter mytili LMG 24559 TaxID=1032238 RepID=A0AAX2AEE7_9BACT|nr:bifunctional phosphopantothenoylcysteine decarboxylase/phosphopantothenate--cysteine ligase CoaBC [Malaciobacter mytili]AXH16118.1 phosphopantothenoylcysteine decarboxylase/phosphopantothenate--cysteine ligase [Malaciobacter mytili LMG 24559]RXI41325.1 bifunctional phosphopantothenoylcysteine decarboxylase/phosphopantothenate--cysteine ligase CoaBC [Malaciobacter mytili]RXK14950.1 bifunctional phosphopantothenoylcysteine decarboxylase/phosphopantothenate--cysteine ligase CoaBC [Malaciobacter 